MKRTVIVLALAPVAGWGGFAVGQNAAKKPDQNQRYTPTQAQWLSLCTNSYFNHLRFFRRDYKVWCEPGPAPNSMKAEITIYWDNIKQEAYRSSPDKYEEIMKADVTELIDIIRDDNKAFDVRITTRVNAVGKRPDGKR